MRRLVALLLLASVALCEEWAGRVWVVRITTERSAFGALSRRTLLAPALPVAEEGLLLAVGFALEPPEDEDEAVKVSAIDPSGRVVPAEIVAGDDDLQCTVFRLKAGKGDLPAPVQLTSAPRGSGDEVILHGRHGEVARYAPRRATLAVEAAVAPPRPLYVLGPAGLAWRGALAVTPEGSLVGFVDERPTVAEGEGAMLGVGTATAVIVPADAFVGVAKGLPREDRPRAWLGVNLAPFDEDREAYFGLDGPWEGALVTGVAEGSPSDRAGIRLHDLVQSVGEVNLRLERIEEWGPMLRLVQQLPLGKPLPCRIVRFRPRPDGSYEPVPLDLQITLEARPLDFADVRETKFEDLGFRVKPVTDDWRRSNRLPADVLGAVVTRVEHASPAQIGGIQPGDLILKLDDRDVVGVASLGNLLLEAREAKRSKLVFFVRRGAATLFLTVQSDG